MYETKEDKCVIGNRCIKRYGCSSSCLIKLNYISYYCHQVVVIKPVHYRDGPVHPATFYYCGQIKNKEMKFLNSENFVFFKENPQKSIKEV